MTVDPFRFPSEIAGRRKPEEPVFTMIAHL